MERPSGVFMSTQTREPHVDAEAMDCESPIKPAIPSIRRLAIEPVLVASAADTFVGKVTISAAAANILLTNVISSLL
jgi:hypothetical protein